MDKIQSVKGQSIFWNKYHVDKISHGQKVKGQSIFGLKLGGQNIAWTESIWTQCFLD